MITCLGKSCIFGFTERVVRELVSEFSCASFPFALEGGVLDLIVTGSLPFFFGFY